MLIVAAAAFLVYKGTSRGSAPTTDATRPRLVAAGSDFVFQDEVRTQWFTQGDVISVPINAKSYKIVVFAVGDTLTLKVPGGTVDMGLGKERYIDLDGDSNPDIRVVWNDVDRGSPQKRVNLGLYRMTGQAAAAAAGGAADAATAIPAACLRDTAGAH